MKILFIANSMEGTLKYRVVLPAKYLNADVAHEINVLTMQAKININVLGKMQTVIKSIADYDIVVLQYAWDDDLLVLIYRCNKLGIRVVLDFDDDYFHSNPYYPIDYSNSNIDKLIRAMEMADLITVTTDSLAETYGKYNKNVKVLPNMIDIAEWDRVYPVNGLPPIVGWYSSGIRFEEFKEIMSGWIPEEVNLYLAGSLIFKNFKHERLEVTDRFNPADTPLILQRIDIGLIPLSLCKFNNGKSDLKGLEYGAMSIPFIASPTVPYQKLIIHGINGFLVHKRKDWKDYINLLINDSKLRYDMGREARKVSEARDIKSNIWRWEEAYQNNS